jgi:hypothetical protein
VIRSKYSGYTNEQLQHIVRQAQYSRDGSDMDDLIHELTIRLTIQLDRNKPKEVLGGTEYNG